VGSVAFGQEISAVVDRAAELLGQTEVTALLSEAYRPGETFGTAFAKLFARVFSELGVILLNGSDPELDSTAAPTYQQAIERASELTRALLGRDEQLRSAGYHQQVRITDSSTLLFMFRDGARLPIHMSAAGGFEIGQGKITPKALLQMCNSTPQVFSPNVLLRPVIQDYVLPTLAYVGGSAEVAYFAQAGAVYSELLGRVTPIVPRFSATIIDPKLNVLLERYNLLLPEVFQGADVLRERIGANLLPPNLQNSFDQATHAVGRSMAAVEASLGQLDKTLVESAQNATSKMLYQITNLRARAARAELRQSEVVGRHAELLSFSLYPEKRLQEREFAGAYFLAKYGRELLQQLLATIHPDCVDHQVLSL
jgi:bacillithiol biosynthesis cysteine-adding enzyme BshC